MEFSRRKLPVEFAESMRRCPIDTVKPYALMLAPVYVFLKLNSKFVSIKAPLDFFHPAELERLRSYETFFFPEFVDVALQYRDKARVLRALLTWKPIVAATVNEVAQTFVPPAAYEVSDAVIRIVGPLWGDGGVIEPFFVSVFVNDVCDLLPGDVLTQAREASFELYERAIFVSSWSVFLALHLGYCELEFLNRLRLRSFLEVIDGIEAAESIQKLATACVENSGLHAFDSKSLDSDSTRIALKIRSRLERVKKEFVIKGIASATIFGQKGFVDG